MDLPLDLSLRVESRLSLEAVESDVLSLDERARLASFGSEARRRSFALGRAVARRMLGERLGVRPQDVPLQVAPDGACEVGVPRLHLSIAHVSTAPQTVAAAACAPVAVGVDLEVLRRRRPDLYTRILSSEEYPLLESLDVEHPQVVLWALKEAVLKARRSGFRCAARDVRLILAPGSARGSATVRGPAERWEVSFVIRQPVVVALAVAEGHQDSPPPRA